MVRGTVVVSPPSASLTGDATATLYRLCSCSKPQDSTTCGKYAADYFCNANSYGVATDYEVSHIGHERFWPDPIISNLCPSKCVQIEFATGQVIHQEDGTKLCTSANEPYGCIGFTSITCEHTVFTSASKRRLQSRQYYPKKSEFNVAMDDHTDIH